MRQLLPGFDQLRTRLLYLVLIALVPVCALVLYGNFELQKQEKDSLRQQAVARARLAAASRTITFATRSICSPLFAIFLS